MGNIISKCDSCLEALYVNYYPKQSWLHPVYTISAGMLGLIGYKITSNEVSLLTQNWNIVYLMAIGGCFGAQVWSTFVSTPILMRMLPRHQFGVVDSSMSLRYYFTTTALSGLSAYIFLTRYPFNLWKKEIYFFGGSVLVSFLMNFFNSTCFAVNSLKYMNKLHRIEKNAGIGTTDYNSVEPLTNNAILANDSDYVETSSLFYLMKSLCTFSNLTSIAANAVQIYFLVNKGRFNL